MARRLPRNPQASSSAVRNVMRANRAKDTAPELVVRGLLRKQGFTGYRLHWKTPAGRIDIAFPGRKVAIEVHGCFWHRCPRCARQLPKRNRAFWRTKFGTNVARDAKVTRTLAHFGWRPFVIWECQTRRKSFQLPKHLLETLAARDERRQQRSPLQGQRQACGAHCL